MATNDRNLHRTGPVAAAYHRNTKLTVAILITIFRRIVRTKINLTGLINVSEQLCIGIRILGTLYTFELQ